MPHDPTSTATSRQVLATELRQLLRAAERRPGRPGRLKRSALARRVGVSASSLYAYLDGTTLPPAGVLAQLLEVLDVAEAERQRLASVRDSLEPRGRNRRAAPRWRDPTVPRQLPADVPGFTGRAAYLDRLDALLPRYDNGATTVVITAIGGTAGVGKTALSLHWAHRVADRFPDGQLHVNLRGFDPDSSPIDPSEVVHGFLDALGVSPERIPATMAARCGRYRSLLAERRMLILLDNARDSAQVRPLLPGAPGCLVVVTSRNELSGLIASEGAEPLVLDLLPAAEARQLLARRVGEDRVAAEPEQAEEIVTRCARLPLALVIVAAQAAARPGFPLAALAAGLRDVGDRLDALAGSEAGTDLRAVFSWSYRRLSPAAARLFRLLSVHPGPEVGAAPVASLAGLAPAQVWPLLAELTRAHLLEEPTPGRYRCHDLLRTYAAELAHEHETPDGRRAALRRLLDHYLHTAHTADRLLYPWRLPVEVGPPAPGVTHDPPEGSSRALAWFLAERSSLQAVIGLAARAGFDAHTCQLAWTIGGFLDKRGYWQGEIVTHRAALAACQRLADLRGQARAHRVLGRAYARLHHYQDAQVHFAHSLQLTEGACDHAGQANAHTGLSWLFGRLGNHRAAIDHAQRALDLHRIIDDRSAQAHDLSTIGWCQSKLGDHHRALASCRQARSATSAPPQPPGTVSPSPTTSSANTGRPPTATCERSRGTTASATAATRARPSPASATTTRPPATPTPLPGNGDRHSGSLSS